MSLTKHHNVQASFLVDDDYVINKTTLNNMNDIPFVKSSFRVFWLRLVHEQETCSRSSPSGSFQLGTQNGVHKIPLPISTSHSP